MTNAQKIYCSIFWLIMATSSLMISGCATSDEESSGAEEMSELAAEDGGSDESSDGDEFDEEFDEKVDEIVDEKVDEKSDSDSQTVAESKNTEEVTQDVPPPQEPQESPPMTSAAPNRVLAINYLASANGGTIEVKTSVPAVYKLRPNPETNQYVLEIENAELVEALKRPFIMKDFEGAFGAVNAYQNTGGRTARIVVQMKETSGEPVVTQEGGSLLIIPPGGAIKNDQMNIAKESGANTNGVDAGEYSASDAESYDVKRAAESEKILAAQTLDEFLTGSGKFFGRPISIETNSADVRDVIKFIAEESGVNLVIADDVDGKVTVKLRQVPWDQALVIVMKSRGLGYVRQGNVLRITKLATLQSEATAAKNIVDSQNKLTPLKVKVMPVSYAVVTDLATQIKPFLSAGRGEVVSDSRTSALIITDTAEVLMRVERLIKELDIPPAQVMIEGKIVEASENFTRQVGVNWSLTGAPFDISSSGGLNGTPLRGSGSLAFNTLTNSQVSGQNGVFTLRIGTLDFLGNLSAALGLAQSDNMVKIISSPRIVTMNKEKAMISQKGEVITIQSSTLQSGDRSTTASRSPIELKLEVTPQITAEGSVVLDVSVLRQFAGAVADDVTKARPINTREAKTKVLVPNGQTAVIGGIYQSDETESESGVPGLKNVPVLGWLFKSRSQEKLKTELLLFLTPRILNAKDQSVAN